MPNASPAVTELLVVTGVFPNWMVFSPGMAPVLAVAVTYVLWIARGHGVMRLIAGPAGSVDS
jgi:hypothetical protein